MGMNSSKIPERTPLTCLLKHWKDLYSQKLKKKDLIFHCIKAWAKYPLGDSER
jgi:hypothetical protein